GSGCGSGRNASARGPEHDIFWTSLTLRVEGERLTDPSPLGVPACRWTTAEAGRSGTRNALSRICRFASPGAAESGRSEWTRCCVFLGGSTMVVVVNALPLRAGGGLTVGLNVVAHLPKVAPGWRFYVLASRGVGYEELQSTNVSVRVVDWPALGPLGQLRYLNLDIPRLSRSVKANVLFTMGNMATVNTTLPQLLLFHKAHFVYPELWPVLFPSAAARRRFLLERAYFRMGLKRSRVVAQTDVMRARLIAQ